MNLVCKRLQIGTDLLLIETITVDGLSGSIYIRPNNFKQP